ncbi:protein sisterless A [Condylostylus longicornis]|uniref:protein sisterless A n=1 Tax=Condylostylus longicornis TaxID=2530218 RepID=UPI00244E3BD9|nr:protein sisterless A [Condylostylus longicornis]
MSLCSDVHNRKIHRTFFPNYTLEAGLILQNLHKNFSNTYDVQLIDNHDTHLLYQRQHLNFKDDRKTWIEQAIDVEMVNIQNHYQQEENQYVERMLIEQPPVVSIRRNTKESEMKDPVQLQKAESCRRSRLNGKIKKAKTRFRHQFVTEKLSKSCNMLRNIYEVIQYAENKLIQGGFDKKVLDELKRTLGMNKNVSELLNIELIQSNNNNTTTVRNTKLDKNKNFSI